jgi:hypothetical protein
MLVGYISDEDDVALHDVVVLVEQGNQWWEARSEANGAIHADVRPGEYTITFKRDSYGGKRVTVAIDDDAPHRFRLVSDRLMGFMWPKWVRVGESAEYRVNSREAFRLDLFRYGWDKEFTRSYGWCGEHGPQAMTQITPDTDYTQTGVHWNQIGYSLEYQKHAIDAPTSSGLYFRHAKTETGSFFSFPWIVSPAAPEASIAVLTSNVTWNAYNSFGGRSNYFSQDGLRPQPTVNARQDLLRYTNPDTSPFKEREAPLSFERPELPSCVPKDARITDPIAGRMGSAFAQGEWRLLGWLEREGFQYDLYSETDLHFGGLSLDAYISTV